MHKRAEIVIGQLLAHCVPSFVAGHIIKEDALAVEVICTLWQEFAGSFGFERGGSGVICLVPCFLEKTSVYVSYELAAEQNQRCACSRDGADRSAW